MTDEPNHQELCDRENKLTFSKRVEDIRLTDHLMIAINRFKIAFACG